MKVVRASAVRFVLEERVVRLPRRPGEEEKVSSAGRRVGRGVLLREHASSGVRGKRSSEVQRPGHLISQRVTAALSSRLCSESPLC